jgi:peptidoglycan pentaglycine glycine transferase (the first glycine)
LEHAETSGRWDAGCNQVAGRAPATPVEFITNVGGRQKGGDLFAGVTGGTRWYNPGVTARVAAADWQTFLQSYPDAHLLQTGLWGQLKSEFGWSHDAVLAGPSGAMLLLRRWPLGMTLAYIPKGPVGPWTPELQLALDRACRSHGAFALKIEPDDESFSQPAESLDAAGFRFSPHTVQPRRTMLVDLAADDDTLLGRMHQKTRYNIRLAEKKAVVVHSWSDLEAFGRMMGQTGERNEFGVHLPAYYRRAYELFHPSGLCEILVAEYDGRPLAAVMVFARGRRAWYFYGASLDLERNRMPTYLLQWEAMRWARQRGCQVYDLWGVPDEEQDVLEAQFPERHDALWGVYRFKRGFGGRLHRSPGTWDRVYQPILYRLYLLMAQRRVRA